MTNLHNLLDDEAQGREKDEKMKQNRTIHALFFSVAHHNEIMSSVDKFD